MAMTINLGSWQFWLVLIVIFFIVIWFIWGGNRDYEIVGIKPLIDLANTVPGTSLYNNDIENQRQLYPTQYQHKKQEPIIRAPEYNNTINYVNSPKICYTASSPIITPNNIGIVENHNVSGTTIDLSKVNPEQLRFIHDYVPYLKYTKQKKSEVSMGETLTGKIFEEYLGRNVMKSIKPDILKNPETGANCEYDIYDDYTRIAIEYSGEQHYVYPHFYHKNEKSFTDLIYRDKLKAQLSDDNGILLIIVPYWVDTCKVDEKSPNGYKVLPKAQLTPALREERLREYLIPILDEIFN